MSTQAFTPYQCLLSPGQGPSTTTSTTRKHSTSSTMALRQTWPCCRTSRSWQKWRTVGARNGLLFVVCWWLVVGGWWLVVGCWLLVVGGWLLVVGCCCGCVRGNFDRIQMLDVPVPWCLTAADRYLQDADVFKQIRYDTCGLRTLLLIKVDPKLATSLNTTLCFSVLVLLIRDNVYMDLRI